MVVGASGASSPGVAGMAVWRPVPTACFRMDELGAQHPARGDGGPSAPNRPNGRLSGSESAKVGDPPCCTAP
eukprot:15454711-Alexandrium_andersonii.AAC.1